VDSVATQDAHGCTWVDGITAVGVCVCVLSLGTGADCRLEISDVVKLPHAPPSGIRWLTSMWLTYGERGSEIHMEVCAAPGSGDKNRSAESVSCRFRIKPENGCLRVCFGVSVHALARSISRLEMCGVCVCVWTLHCGDSVPQARVPSVSPESACIAAAGHEPYPRSAFKARPSPSPRVTPHQSIPTDSRRARVCHHAVKTCCTFARFKGACAGRPARTLPACLTARLGGQAVYLPYSRSGCPLPGLSGYWGAAAADT
jgi:hypothetical protein